MNRIQKIMLMIVLMSVNAAMCLAADGVKIVSKTKNLGSGKISATNIYLTNDKVLVENRGGNDNGSFYFDSAKEEFGYVDHIKREYYLFDKPAMEQLKQQIQMMVMMMKQFASQMPKEQKDKLDKLMNPDAANSTEFKSTKEKLKVGKWTTTKYEGIAEGNKITDMYIAPFSSMKVSKDDFAAMEKMISYFRENLSEVVALLPAGGSFSQIGFDESSPIFREGIPVKTISYKSGNPSDENTVESVTKEYIDNSVFNIPAGYKRQEIKMDAQFGK